MRSEDAYIYIEPKDMKHIYRVNFNDLNVSFDRNFQLNSTYEISFTLTLTQQYRDVFNTAKGKIGVWYNKQWYVIETWEPGVDDKGLTTLKVTCVHTIVDHLKNIRKDPPEPTEDNPQISGGTTTDDNSDSDVQPQAGVVVKKISEKQTYSLDDCLKTFLQDNDQGIDYEIHGVFPQLSVECKGSLFDWIRNNLKDFGAFWIPDGLTIKVYDLSSLKHQTGKVFRYMANMTNVDLQYNVRDLVNDCWCYAGKMEKDITTVSGGAGGGGSLDSAEAFAKSPINASFGVNKQQMLNDFAAKDVRVRAWGVDVNRLYDTVKGAGVSPEWFFAYDLAEGNPTSYSWLNHFGSHLADPYQDAIRVCSWIKEFANSDSFTPATGYGAYASPQMTAQWNQEFGKGTIGRLYLQGTAAAVMEMANENSGRYGRPLSQCISFIKGWGGHTVTNGGSWGWPFPSVGEGHFMDGQLFGTHPGNGRTNNFHDGLDFGSIDHPGSEVHAIHGGTCTISRAWGSGGINWYCVIQDSSGLNVEYQEAFGSASNITVNVGQKVKTGDVIGYRTTNHLHVGITKHNVQEAFGHAFNDDGTWIDPLATIKNGGAGGDSGDSGDSQTTSATTKEIYYSIVYHYEDQESIKEYGRYRGKPIVQDSIYDLNILKQFVANTVQHQPATTLTIKGIEAPDAMQGDVWKVIAPELGFSSDVTLMSIKGNDEAFCPGTKLDLSFNNIGLSMRDVNATIWSDISDVNANLNPLEVSSGAGTKDENHLNNEGNKKDTGSNNKDSDGTKYSENQMKQIEQITSGERVKWNG